MKVWIVNSSGHDFSKAEKFGDEMEPLTYGRVNIFNVGRLINEFKYKLREFNKDDWLLLSGNAVLNSLAVSLIIEKTGGVNLLIYDVINKEYVPREVTADQFKE